MIMAKIVIVALIIMRRIMMMMNAKIVRIIVIAIIIIVIIIWMMVGLSLVGLRMYMKTLKMDMRVRIIMMITTTVMINIAHLR